MTTENYFNLATLTLLFAGILATWIEIHTLRIAQKDNHDWQRRQSAQNRLADNAGLLSIKSELAAYLPDNHRQGGLNKNQLDTLFEQNPELKTNIRVLLNYYESLCRGINQGIYDETVVRIALRGSIIGIYRSYQYYVSERRKLFDNPSLYSMLESQVILWESEGTQEPREQTGSRGL